EHRLVVGILIVILELEEVRRAVRIQLVAVVGVRIQLRTAARSVAEVVAGRSRAVPRILKVLVQRLVEIVLLVVVATGQVEILGAHRSNGGGARAGAGTDAGDDDRGRNRRRAAV